jgi:hypothetical protein
MCMRSSSSCAMACLCLMCERVREVVLFGYTLGSVLGICIWIGIFVFLSPLFDFYIPCSCVLFRLLFCALTRLFASTVSTIES